MWEIVCATTVLFKYFKIFCTYYWDHLTAKNDKIRIHDQELCIHHDLVREFNPVYGKSKASVSTPCPCT